MLLTFTAFCPLNATIGDYVPSKTNILQQYCDGQLKLDSLKSININSELFAIDVTRGKYKFPSAEEYFGTAMYDAIMCVAFRKGLDSKSEKAVQLQVKIKELDAIWKQIQNSTIAVKNEKHEQKEEPAPESYDPKVPKQYRVQSLAFSQINKTAARIPHPKTPVMDVRKIESMGIARAKLAAVVKPDVLNALVPQHRAVGDALFNEAIMRRLEYAYTPENGHTNVPGALPATRDRAHAALSAIYTITEDNAELVRDDVGKANGEFLTELQKLRASDNERLKRQLQAFPELAIAALGDDDQL